MTAVTCQWFSSSLCHRNCHYLVARYRHTGTECCISRKKMVLICGSRLESKEKRGTFLCIQLQRTLGANWSLLLTFCALLGCDDTSSFQGKRWNKAFQILKHTHTGIWIWPYYESKKKSKYQESIQSSTPPDPGYQWESNNFTIRHNKREPRGQPFPSRWPQDINTQTRTKT